jgi:putative membrane protein
MLERKVWILGDRGIDRKIGREQWVSLAQELSVGIRENRACDALCSVVGKIGTVLSEHFPRKADDVNELTDAVMQ